MRIAFFAALAAAGLMPSCAAVAADGGTSVQLYGIVDAGVAVTRVSGQGSQSGLLNGGLTDSLWGLQGTEGLGSGWTASFQLESGFDPSSGTAADSSRLFNYGAWVGLAHASYGDLRLGRQYTVGQTYGNALEIASWKDMGMGATFKASDNYQFSNMVNWYSPQWQGFQAGVGYAFDADGQDQFRTNQNTRAISLGLKYEDGPLLAVATWEQLRLATRPAPPAAPRVRRHSRWAPRTTSRWSRCLLPGRASATVTWDWTAATPTDWASGWDPRPSCRAARSTPGWSGSVFRPGRAPSWCNGRWPGPIGVGTMA